MDTTTQKINELATKAQNPDNSWIWKLAGGLLLLLGVWWLRYQLSLKSEELAVAKTELEVNKINATKAAVDAKVEVDLAKRDAAMALATESLAKVAAHEAELAKITAEHKTNVAKLAAVADKDWGALNKLAGVK